MTQSSLNSRAQVREPEIQRLLLVADVAVAGSDDFPPSVRALIDAASEVFVVTPTLPGRLAWLADDVDWCRHIADERLDRVLGNLRSIGAQVSGAAIRGSVLAVIGDAVATFKPDHMLLALRSAEHANWQERGLTADIEDHFGLHVTTYAVDLDGHTSAAEGPLLLCYDGSENARHAIRRAGTLVAGKKALVVTVWPPSSGLGSLAWSGATASMVTYFELDRAAAEEAGRIAGEGVRIAREAGLEAEPIAIETSGPVWKTIVDLAARHDAATIVLGSRGISGMRSKLLGSVSSAVVDHAGRPTLVIRPAAAAA